MWQPSCWKLGEKFNINSGNEVVKNEGKKKKEDLGRKLKGKLWQLICGNGIVEMGGKKIVAVDLWQCCCQNGREKKCGNGERERERERESCLDKKNYFGFLF